MLDRISKGFITFVFSAKSKLPKDTNQRAVMIAKIATGEIEAPKEETDLIKVSCFSNGKEGGLKGGKSRAKALTSKRRTEIAKKGCCKVE